MSGLETCVTDRCQDLGDAPPSAGGVERDRAAVSRGVGSAGWADGDGGRGPVRGLTAGCTGGCGGSPAKGLNELADRSRWPRSHPVQVSAA